MRNQRFLSLLLAVALFASSVFFSARVSAATASAQANAAAFTVDDALDVVQVGVADLSDDGRWLVATASTLRDRIGINNHRFGDPTYVAPALAEVLLIETTTGRTQKIFPDKRQVRSLRLSPDGSRVAMLLWSAEGGFQPVIWERADNTFLNFALPADKMVAENTALDWSADGAQLRLALRQRDWQKQAADKFKSLTSEPVVVLSSKEPFLAWEELRRLAQVRSLATYEIKTRRLHEVVAETKINSYNFADDGAFVIYNEDQTQKTDYDTIGGTDNRVQLRQITGGEPRTLIKSTKGLNLIWSRDLRRYAYTKDGNIFTATIDEKEPRQLTGSKEEPASAAKRDADKAAPDKSDNKGDNKGDDKSSEASKPKRETFAAMRLSATGDRVIASNKEGLWLIDTATGVKENFLKQKEEDKQAPRYNLIDWSADGDNIYFSYAARVKWERGLVRYNTRTKEMKEMLKDERLYAGARLSKDGRTMAFSASDGNRPADLYVADSELKNISRLTNANPQLANRRLSKTELVSYLDADGARSYGVLYYPVDYQPGKKYPTIFNIYEQFFDDTFNATLNVLTNNGYAVMLPSVNLEQGFPGEAWAKGVTAAANKLIEMGVADAERLGVQGTSYGGYATNLLITQTGRFKAAINISGKVNMVSFYTDSPRLGTRNTHAPEKSQDRLGATLWQQPQKYIAHSAVMFADRIKTPLLLITGEQDHNVPARQAMEMYYALRRLGKEVEWVSYTNGGHGMPTTTVAEVKDYHARILKWYDDHLKGDAKKKADAAKPDAGQ